MKAPERVITDATVFIDFTYNYRVGPYLERYIQELGNGKIMAVKCPGCTKVAVPPRKVCGSCNRVMDEWVEVGPAGEVFNFTVAHVRLDRGAVEAIDEPEVIALVLLDGATVPLLARLEGVAPEDVERGLKVKAVFADPATNSLTDLSHFEPAGQGG